MLHEPIEVHYQHPSIPIAFQDATLLPAFAHPDHLLLVGSQGFAHLSPGSILKSNRYIWGT
ncbi:hypothetical protein GZ78_13895 [Endozoicomonas numazuensis]|uniref:Uncharacterized protein n=1 Tax=Endozoicomonas numazuensis TaxID=1137799 RepID=A0A081NJC8_9GAMM|nr:hypothetical protein GZ78_13895 [Endozoicomonas numazuensis]